jgi:hypothetical protein
MALEATEGVGEHQEEGHQLMHVTLVQGGALPDNKAYYLDGCSTVTAFKSKKYLKEVEEQDAGIKINCNAGEFLTNLMGKYGSINAWYIPEGIANIFSVHELEKKHRIAYDSWQGYYKVHMPSKPVRFYKDEQGLPYIDLLGREAAVMLLEMAVAIESKDGHMNVQTVRENYEGYTKREVLKAKEARRVQGLIGNPSKGDYKAMVRGNMIQNFPIIPDNITNVRTIFGPDLASIRGKTVRRTPAPVVGDYLEVSQSVVQNNKIVTMAADVFFVDETVFLITVLRRIKFITVEHMQVRMASSLCKHLERVLQVYARTGFVVRTILMDAEFEKVQNCLPNVECNTTAAKEHISEAERTIRTIKEQARGLIATLPFTDIPCRMKIEFMYFVVLWLNVFPVMNRILSTFLTRELLVRWKLDYNKHCWVLPGTYCKAHDEPSPSNTMMPCIHETMAFGPMGNLQGGVKLYCLTTGQLLKRRSLTPLPMPDCIIKRVNTIGAREKQGCKFCFLNRCLEPYEWTDAVPEDDPKFQGLLEEEEPVAYPDISAELRGVELESEEEDFQVLTDKPEPDFADLAATVLENAGIDPNECICQVREATADGALGVRLPAIVKVDEDKVVYKITFNLPGAGLGMNTIPPDNILPVDAPNAIVPNVPMAKAAAATHIPDLVPKVTTGQRYPTRARRRAVGNQPYNTFAPRMMFLQLGEAQAHRSVLNAMKYVGMTRNKQLHAPVTSLPSRTHDVNNIEHMMDP